MGEAHHDVWHRFLLAATVAALHCPIKEQESFAHSANRQAAAMLLCRRFLLTATLDAENCPRVLEYEHLTRSDNKQDSLRASSSTGAEYASVASRKPKRSDQLYLDSLLECSERVSVSELLLWSRKGVSRRKREILATGEV
jgi:hypothetical protein